MFNTSIPKLTIFKNCKTSTQPIGARKKVAWLKQHDEKK